MRLKGIITLALSMAIIANAVLISIALNANAESTDGWNIDFSSGISAVEDNVFFDATLKTTASYSAEEKAAVFKSDLSNLSSATRTPGFILGGTVTTTSNKPLSTLDSAVDKYPIIAIRLKLSDSDITVDRFDWTTDNYEKEGSGKWRSMTGATAPSYSGTSALKATTDWQTVIIDTRKDTNATTLSKLTGNWSGFRFLFKSPVGKNEATYVSVSFIGVYESVDGVPKDADPSPFIVEFDSAEKINSVARTEGGLKTALKYDEQESALSMTSTVSNLASATRTPGVIIGGAGKFDIYNSSVDDYPVIAAYIKLYDESITFDRFDWTTTYYEASGEATPYRSIASSVKLSATTEWQLVYFDTSLSTGNDAKWRIGCWSGFRLFFKSATGKSEPARVDVKWVGAFESISDAKEKAGIEEKPATVGEVFIDFSSEKSVSNYVSSVSALNTDYRFDTQTGCMTLTSNVSNLSEDTRTPGVIVGSAGKLTESFVSNVKEYPVIALYMKASNENVSFDRFDWTTTVYESSGEATPWRSMTNYCTYKHTTEWQLVCVDTSTLTAKNDTKWLQGNWSGFRLLYMSPKELAEPVSVSVAWIGTFRSVDEAWKKAGLEEKTLTRGQMFLDFSSRETIDSYVYSNTSLNTDYYYDDVDKALTLTSTVSDLTEDTRTPGVMVGANGKITADFSSSVKDYPVIAAYIKLGNSSLKFDRFDWTTTTYEASGNATPFRSMTSYIKLMRSTDWQLIYVDTRTLTSKLDTDWLSGDWSGFRFLFKSPAGVSEKMSAKIKWVGTFASVNDAKAKAGIEVKPPKKGPMLIEFNGIAPIDSYVKTNTSLNTVFDYDKNDNALVMKSTVSNLKESQRTPGVIIGGSGMLTENYASSVTEYPVIAAYIKLSDKSVSFDRFDWTTTTYEASGEATPWRNATACFKLKNTTDWQLVYFDTSKLDNKNDTVWLSGDWSGFRLLGKTAEGLSEPTSISVRWIGTFANVQDAKQLAGETEKKKSEHPGFYKFDTAESLSIVNWTSLDDTDISFDENEKAMKVTATDAVSGENHDGKIEKNVAHFTIDINDDISCAQYRCLAMKIKTSNKNSRSGWYGYRSTDSEELGSQFLNMVRPKYEETTDWQTVIIDCCEENSMYDYYTGYWTGLSFDLGLSGFAKSGDTFLVSWIGLFRNEKEAMEAAGIKLPSPKKPVAEKVLQERGVAKYVALGIAMASVVILSVLVITFRKKIFRHSPKKQ